MELIASQYVAYDDQYKYVFTRAQHRFNQGTPWIVHRWPIGHETVSPLREVFTLDGWQRQIGNDVKTQEIIKFETVHTAINHVA